MDTSLHLLCISLFTILFTLHVLIKVATFYYTGSLWPYADSSMAYGKAFLNQISFSHSVNWSPDPAKYLKIGSTVSMQLFLSVLKILCMSLILNQGLIMFHLCWLSRLHYRCFPVKALACCIFVLQVEASPPLAVFTASFPSQRIFFLAVFTASLPRGFFSFPRTTVLGKAQA